MNALPTEGISPVFPPSHLSHCTLLMNGTSCQHKVLDRAASLPLKLRIRGTKSLSTTSSETLNEGPPLSSETAPASLTAANGNDTKDGTCGAFHGEFANLLFSR